MTLGGMPSGSLRMMVIMSVSVIWADGRSAGRAAAGRAVSPTYSASSAAAAATGHDPMSLLSALVLDSGRCWGEVATPWQRADARALLTLDLDAEPPPPRLHFLTRPRGGSKTVDAAACATSALITQAPPGSTSHAFARDRDQAGLLVGAVAGLVGRTGLGPLVDIGSWSVTVRASGARLVVESADAASAYGHLPFLVVADELAQWGTTREPRALWEALVSGLPKRRDSRLAVLTTAGDPTHWAAKVLDAARTSPRWHVSEVPGPVPWADPETWPSRGGCCCPRPMPDCTRTSGPPPRTDWFHLRTWRPV
jgi:hypothetical protein